MNKPTSVIALTTISSKIESNISNFHDSLDGKTFYTHDLLKGFATLSTLQMIHLHILILQQSLFN